MTAVTLVLAATAGLASFLSPCMLPVVPAFLAQLAGTAGAVGSEGRDGWPRRATVFAHAALFVVGFALVFAAVGVALGAVIAGAAATTMAWLSRVAGVVIVGFGLHATGLLRLPALERTYAPGDRVRLRGSYAASLVVGGAFAVGWTPCVGVLLGSVYALAATQPAMAAPLLVAYAGGLGAPFLVVALVPARATRRLRRHRRGLAWLERAFGGVLLGLGVLVFTQRLSLLGGVSLPGVLP